MSAPLAEGKALMLRTCDAQGRSYGRFQWPDSGPVSAPDWKPEAECGHGLHGLLWGEGDGSLLSWEPDARWIVAEVVAADVVELGGKVKVPAAVVLYCSARLGATAFLAERAAGRAIAGGTATAGYRGTATAGYRGTATAGYRGTATAGDFGILNVRWYDGSRYRIATWYVGEDGIEPGTAYRCKGGNPVKVERAE